MADYESNLIKPVKSLQTITGLTPARQRDERKRRQQLHQDEQTMNEETMPEKKTETEGENEDNRRDGARIDYCA